MGVVFFWGGDTVCVGLGGVCMSVCVWEGRALAGGKCKGGGHRVGGCFGAAGVGICDGLCFLPGPGTECGIPGHLLSSVVGAVQVGICLCVCRQMDCMRTHAC